MAILLEVKQLASNKNKNGSMLLIRACFHLPTSGKMRTITTLLILLSAVIPTTAQNKYTALWNREADLYMNSRYYEADSLAFHILTTAKSENNTQHYIRAFTLLAGTMRLKPFDAPDIWSPESVIETASFPNRQLLHYVYSSILYSNYLIHNDSTNTYWDKDRQMSAHHIEASLEPAERLLNIPISQYKDQLKIEDKLPVSCTSLYHLLALNAIYFYLENYTSDEVISDKYRSSLLGSDQLFLDTDFAQDTLQYPILKTFVVFKNFYKAPNLSPGQKVELCIERCKLAQRILCGSEQTLTEIDKLAQNTKGEQRNQIAYLQACLLSKVPKLSPAQREKALDLCNHIIQTTHDPMKRYKATALKQEIGENKIFSFNIEPSVYPNRPSLCSISYHNIDTIYFSFYRYPIDVQNDESLYHLFKVINQNNPMYIQRYALPKNKSDSTLRCEIMLPALDKGNYLVMASTSKDPTSWEDILSYKQIYSTHLSSTLLYSTEGSCFQVTDRYTGAPISDATIELKAYFKCGWDHLKKEITTKREVLMEGKTNNKGLWMISNLKKSDCHMLAQISHHNDTILSLIATFNLGRTFWSYHSQLSYLNDFPRTLFSQSSNYDRTCDSIRQNHNNLETEMVLPSIQSIAQPLKINYQAKRPNGQTIPTQLNIKIQRTPNSLKTHIPREWSAPDTTIITKQTFTQTFPQFAYSKQDISLSGYREKTLWAHNFPYADQHIITINDAKNWPPGNYKTTIEAITSHKDTVTTQGTFSIETTKEYTTNLTMPLTIEVKELNEHTILAQLYSEEKQLSVQMNVYDNGKIIMQKNIAMKKGKRKIHIPIKPNVPTYTLDFHYTKYGRTIRKRYSITPQLRRKNTLYLETVSFRNDTEKEQWSFRVMEGSPHKQKDRTSTSSHNLLNLLFSNHPNKHHYSNYYAPEIYSMTSFNNKSLNKSHYNLFYTPLPNYWYYSGILKDTTTVKGVGEYLNIKGSYRKKNEPFIYGYVYDQKYKPLSNVFIHFEGENSVYKTYSNGFYIIPYDKNNHLKLSRYGYETKEIRLSNKGLRNIYLNPTDSTNTCDIDSYLELFHSDQYISTSNIFEHITSDQFDVTLPSLVFQSIPSFRVIYDDLPVVVAPLVYEDDLSVQEIDYYYYPKNITYNWIPITYKSKGKNHYAISPKDTSLVADSILVTTDIMEDHHKEILDKNRTWDKLDKPISHKGTKRTTRLSVKRQENKSGTPSFNFDTPKPISQWKLTLFTHQKDADSIQKRLSIIVKKSVHIRQIEPSIDKERKRIKICATIDNLTNRRQKGTVSLHIYDSSFKSPIQPKTVHLNPEHSFVIRAKGSQTVTWEFKIPPIGYTLKYKVIAKTREHTDIEVNELKKPLE
ncbi:hypothetical protein K5X82_05120 [Halosquirtibacter xylanolyticus]|uniref:alpha-2-macroglobulin family protein n=1 Tax=Halosquirtibacter xylanolyticus TaxID=3374599 RepID=UPI003748CDE5|nr:hypothetical protein K5X82_05120 [Prolixibacteraceae bacterium]